MAVINQRIRATDAVLRSKPRHDDKRLPPGIAFPLIAVISASLWLILFRLFALLF